MKDRLDDALQSRSLSDNLIAPCHLSTQSLRRLVRNPDFWQEAAGIELRKNVGVDRRFDLGIGNDKHLFRLGDPHLLHMRRNHSCSGRRVAGCPRSPRHRSATRSRRMSTRPCHCFGEGAVNIQSDDKHARSSFLGSGQRRELAGNTTSTDPRSQRIRESREGRPCNELGLSAHGLLTACLHLCAPGAPRPGWAHHKGVPKQEQQDEKAPQITYRIAARPSASSRWACANGLRPSLQQLSKTLPDCCIGSPMQLAQASRQLRIKPPISRLGLERCTLLGSTPS